MGLDMYLYADKYIANADYFDKTHPKQFETILNTIDMKDVHADESAHITVSVCVGYWRKANAIHDWFVREVQDGVDECQRSYVPLEKLEQLYDTAIKAHELYVQGDKQGAATLLTPTTGFFFGSTEVNEWYAEELKRTVEIIEPLLRKGKGFGVDFYYQSSW